MSPILDPSRPLLLLHLWQALDVEENNFNALLLKVRGHPPSLGCAGALPKDATVNTKHVVPRLKVLPAQHCTVVVAWRMVVKAGHLLGSSCFSQGSVPCD